MNSKKTRLFAFQWLIALCLALVFIIAAMVGFCTNRLGFGIASAFVGAIYFIRYVFFVPHSFAFDKEVVTLFYVFKLETIKYRNIKSCDKEISGVRHYPWGEYYRVCVDKPCPREIKIPFTAEIGEKITKHINVQNKKYNKKK